MTFKASGDDTRSADDKSVDELVELTKADSSIPDYARTLISLLHSQLGDLRKEQKALRKYLGPGYKRAIG